MNATRDEQCTVVPGGGPDLSIGQLTEMEAAARRVAGRYARRCWWVDPDDLTQAAWVALLRAAPEFIPDLGVPFGAYCWRIAVNAVRRATLAASSPATGGHHRPAVLRNLTRVSLEVEAEGGDARERAEVSARNAANRPDAAYRTAALRARVQARVAALVGEQGAPFALAVFGGEFSPGEIADHHGVAVREVYRLRARVKRILRGDAHLYRLWKELIK